MSNRIANQIRELFPGGHEMSDDASLAVVSERAVDHAKRATEQIERVIGSYPIASVGVALAAGIAMGCWVKRK